MLKLPLVQLGQRYHRRRYAPATLPPSALVLAFDSPLRVPDVVFPNKTDAVSYLDANGSIPLRWATASIMFGATEEPYIQEFQVGPLPITNESSQSACRRPCPRLFADAATSSKPTSHWTT